VAINERSYRGSIEPLGVYNAICAGFANPPEICRQTLGIYTPAAVQEALSSQASAIRGGKFALIVILVVLLNVMIVYCYRRYTKRELQSNMND